MFGKAGSHFFQVLRVQKYLETIYLFNFQCKYSKFNILIIRLQIFKTFLRLEYF